jgi:hypothetical protein
MKKLLSIAFRATFAAAQAHDPATCAALLTLAPLAKRKAVKFNKLTK